MRCATLAVVLALGLTGCGAILGIDDVEPGAAPPDASGCAAPSMTCGGACIDVQSSPDHCGRCDHACGGPCFQSRCLPLEVARDLDGPLQLAPTASALYFTHRTGVTACADVGCAAPQAVATGFERLSALAVAGDKVFFFGSRNETAEPRYRLYQCPTTGCGDTPPAPIATTEGDVSFSDLDASATHIYWRNEGVGVYGCAVADCASTLASWPELAFSGDVTALDIDTGNDRVYIGSGGNMRRCLVPSGCGTSTELAGSDVVRLPFRSHRGVAYWVAETSGVMFLFACDVEDCDDVVQLARDQPGVKELAVDDTGVYWVNDVTGTVRHCPLTGCPVDEEQTYLAKNRVVPELIALGPGFVYWIEGKSIIRVAKP